jgi:hypothetical protein
VKETWFVGFNLGRQRLGQTREILRRVHLTGSAELDEETSPLAGLCSIRLPYGDPRLAALQDELDAVGAEATVRLERSYSHAELDRFEWLILIIRTVGLAGHSAYRQAYDRQGACHVCGRGAVPVAPLVADLRKMGKKPLDQTADGDIIATADLANAIGQAALTGVEVRPAQGPTRQEPESHYRWLHVTSEWGPMLPSSSAKALAPCPNCGRSGFFVDPDRPHELHYRAPPSTARDFNNSWERFGYWATSRRSSSSEPTGGAPPLHIISQRARRILDGSGVRRVEFQPIVFESA